MKGDNSVYNSAWDEENVIWDETNGTLAIININRPVYGDFIILCSELTNEGNHAVLFRYWAHTHFLPITLDDESSIGTSTVRLFKNTLLVTFSICSLSPLPNWISLMVVFYPMRLLFKSR